MASNISVIASPAMETSEPAAKDQSAASNNTSAWSGLLTANASLIAWLVLLAFGGALLSLYYTHIQYFPDLEWEETVTYLAALSILGGSVAVLYGLLLYVPGVMWSEFLIHDSELEAKMCYVGKGPEPCYWTVGKYIGLPFLGLMLVSHAAGLLGLGIFIAASGVVLVLISRFLWVTFGGHIASKSDAERVTDARKETLLLKYVGSFDVSAIASLTSLLLLFKLAKGEGELKEPWALLAACTVLVTVANFLVAVQHRQRPGKAVVTAALATLVLLAFGEFIADGDAAVSKRLMGHFGVGGERVHTIAVNQEGIKALQGFEILSPKAPGSDVALIKDAKILSRLGTEYYIEVGTRRLAIPRSHIYSWSAVDSNSK